jgi:hypothetical protein
VLKLLQGGKGVLLDQQEGNSGLFRRLDELGGGPAAARKENPRQGPGDPGLSSVFIEGSLQEDDLVVGPLEQEAGRLSDPRTLPSCPRTDLSRCSLPQRNHPFRYLSYLPQALEGKDGVFGESRGDGDSFLSQGGNQAGCRLDRIPQAVCG